MEGGGKSGLESSLNQEKQQRDHELHGEIRQQRCCSRADVIEEVKKQLWLAGPLIAVSMLQYCLQVISIMFVGHIGELPLASASMASSFASVTGFSILLGGESALETLCGQACGAKQYNMLGIYTQRAIASSIPLAIVWIFTSTILISLGQDHEISILAGMYNG